MQTDFSIPTILSASSLNGASVESPQGEGLGKIRELMVDLEDGRIAYVLLSFGGALGIGEKLIAIPWGAVYVDTMHQVIVLDVDRETLENAPSFDIDDWPDACDRSWVANLYDHYGYRPYWK